MTLCNLYAIVHVSVNDGIGGSLVASTDPIVQLRRASRTYGSVVALQGIDLAVNAGELVAVLGPNGAGKTTAISLMLGLRVATGGEVRLFGLPPSSRHARSRCGAMLQESGVPRLLTVNELIELFRAYYAHPLPTSKVLEMALLQDLAGRRAAALSGGERQRLYFALAICGAPELLFLDEPTVGMDVETRSSFLQSIREFASQGRTIVLTTHYLEEADQLAQRVVVMSGGRIIADTSPAEIKKRVPGRRLSFTADRALTVDDFAGLDVDGVRIEGRCVKALSNQPQKVIHALVNRQIGIGDLEVSGASLEEAFLVLTRSGGRAA